MVFLAFLVFQKNDLIENVNKGKRFLNLLSKMFFIFEIIQTIKYNKQFFSF